MPKQNLSKIMLYFFCLIIASHLWAGGDKIDDKKKKRLIEEMQSVESAAPRRERRTNVFCNALRKVEQAARKCVKKARCSMAELVQALDCTCLDSQTLDSQTLDKQGELTLKLAGLMEEHRDIENASTPDDSDSSENNADIELRKVYERSLTLIKGTVYTLAEEELARVLQSHPGYQGKVSNSAMLYQILRALYLFSNKDEQALVNLEQEFNNLPLRLIEEYDPIAFVHYAELLRVMGRTDEAFEFLRSNISLESQPLIRRQTALWEAKNYEKTGDLINAENAYIKALIAVSKYPDAYLALINFYFEHGERSLAEALTGVMTHVILPSQQWQEYKNDIQAYIDDQLPESLLLHEYSRRNLVDAIRLWVSKSILEESSAYWVPLVKELLKDSDRKSMNSLLVRMVADLSMSIDQQLNYYKSLYAHYEDWAPPRFPLGDFEQIMLSQFNQKAEYPIGDAGQTFQLDFSVLQMAQLIIEHDPKAQSFKKMTVNTLALGHLIRFYRSKKNTDKAIYLLIELIEKQDEGSHDALLGFMEELAPFMTEEHAELALVKMLGNYSRLHYFTYRMINPLVERFGKETIAEMLDKESLKKEESYEHFFSDVDSFLRLWKKGELKPLNYNYEPLPQKKSRFRAPANRLSELLRSINIVQHRVPGDGYCMWHSLLYGLQQAGIYYPFDVRELHRTIAQYVSENHTASSHYDAIGSRAAAAQHFSVHSYAPGNWGVSDHLAAAAGHFNVHIIELLQTGVSQLSGTHFQPPLSTDDQITQIPLVGADDILGTLQELHNEDKPFIIMINNTQVNEDGSLELNDGNHWTAGVWSPSSTPLPAPDMPEIPAIPEELYPIINKVDRKAIIRGVMDNGNHLYLVL